MSKKIENVIYILTNPQYPGYVKIGYASDLQSRVSTLNTGMLIPFSPYAVYETSLHNADVEIHAIIKLLNPILRASNFDKKGKVQVKEFFKLEPEEAFDLLKHIAKLTGTEGKLYKVTADFQRIQPQVSPIEIVKPVEAGLVDPPPVVPDGIYYMNRKIKRCGRYSIQHDEEREKYWNGEFVGCPWYNSRNDGYEYWHRNYLSGCRKYAKSCTNRRIRSKYRMQIRMMDPEDIMAPQCSDYEKEFDYLWTIY